ncbi:MAG TPA: prepilin-type N-terminal cleavage/methylation domain-containing protein [Kofleriaceae bacterium]|nr:prepilin-type N-terminal cleavage/methylation domain-containing protein [Kofleriaceae bacterium]
MTRRSERGFTLIELMIALIVSSLLVGMILAIFSRMSISYRGQQQIAGVQQVLAAARATIELDAKQAGLELAGGFRSPTDGGLVRHNPVAVTDSATGPDQVAFFYADTTAQAVVTDATGWPASAALTVDNAAAFSVASTPFVVIVNINTSTANGALPGNGSSDAVITTFNACMLQLASVTATQLRFTTAAPWGSANESHCTSGTAMPAVNVAANQTMVFNFVARAYRIDTTSPARMQLGVLQQSPSGALLGAGTNDWLELAYGFTDIQIATRMYESGSLLDPDLDGDFTHNWYSAVEQNAFATNVDPALKTPIQLSISLVARTDRDVEGIATAATPTLLDPAKPLAFNSIGNRASVALPSTTDNLLMGSNIFRYITFQVDLRNMGVGR